MDQIDVSQNGMAQLQDFRTAVRSHIGNLSVTPTNPSNFTASFQQANYGFLHLVRLDCAPILVERTPDGIVGDDARDYMLALQVEGTGKTRQAGREVTLEPTDFSIVDSAMPYSLEFDGPVKRVVLRLPRSEVRRRGGLSENQCCRVYRGSSGLSAIASNMVLSIASHGSAVSGMMHKTLATTVLDLVLFAQAEGAQELPPLSHSNEATVQRVRALVLANLSDPDLSTDRVAALAGISVRYVHKLFRGTGRSLNAWIREERLAACYRCLASPAQANRSIMDIALSNGFNDSSYFSHLFSERYGLNPSQVRNCKGGVFPR